MDIVTILGIVFFGGCLFCVGKIIGWLFQSKTETTPPPYSSEVTSDFAPVIVRQVQGGKCKYWERIREARAVQVDNNVTPYEAISMVRDAYNEPATSGHSTRDASHRQGNTMPMLADRQAHNERVHTRAEQMMRETLMLMEQQRQQSNGGDWAQWPEQEQGQRPIPVGRDSVFSRQRQHQE